MARLCLRAMECARTFASKVQVGMVGIIQFLFRGVSVLAVGNALYLVIPTHSREGVVLHAQKRLRSVGRKFESQR